MKDKFVFQGNVAHDFNSEQLANFISKYVESHINSSTRKKKYKKVRFTISYSEGDKVDDRIEIKMKKETFEKILGALDSKKEGMLDDESIAYANDKEYPFTHEEYNKATEFLEQDVFKGWWTNKKYDYSTVFEEKRGFFMYKGKKYIFRTLGGQGTSYQILDGKHRFEKFWPDKTAPMKYDKEKQKVLNEDMLVD